MLPWHLCLWLWWTGHRGSNDKRGRPSHVAMSWWVGKQFFPLRTGILRG
jgi:hypothetical protein